MIITLAVYPKLVKDVPENACHQAYEDVEKNKKSVRLFLIVSIAMILAGVLMMIL